MNGPTFQLKFTKGESYKIPQGYGCMAGDILGGQFLYTEAIYKGTLKVKEDYDFNAKHYLVFESENKGVFVCEPNASFDEEVLSVCLKVLANQATIRDCVNKMSEPKEISFSFEGEIIA